MSAAAAVAAAVPTTDATAEPGARKRRRRLNLSLQRKRAAHAARPTPRPNLVNLPAVAASTAVEAARQPTASPPENVVTIGDSSDSDADDDDVELVAAPSEPPAASAATVGSPVTPLVVPSAPAVSESRSAKGAVRSVRGAAAANARRPLPLRSLPACRGVDEDDEQEDENDMDDDDDDFVSRQMPSAAARRRRSRGKGPATPSPLPRSSSSTSAVAATSPLLAMLANPLSPATTACPVCQQRVPLASINTHLDRACLRTGQGASAAAAEPAAAPTAAPASPVQWFRLSPGAALPPHIDPPVEHIVEDIDDAKEEEQEVGAEGAKIDNGGKEEQDKEPEEAACFTCGEPGHFSRDCPTGPYYEHNFRLVVSTVLASAHFAPLLTAADRQLLDSILTLPPPQLRLLIRLFLRKPGWVRLDKLAYREIGDNLETPAAALVAAGLLESEKAIASASEALALLQMPELRALAKSFALPKLSGRSRPDLVSDLETFARSQPSMYAASSDGLLLHRACKRVGRCLRVGAETRGIVDMCEQLFFMNTAHKERSLSTLLLVNMQKLVYPAFEISPPHAVFASRAELRAYMQALELEHAIETAAARREPAAALAQARSAEAPLVAALAALPPTLVNAAAGEPMTDPPPPTAEQLSTLYLRRFTAGWVHARVLSLAVELLESQHDYAEAARLLRLLLSQADLAPDRRGRWWDRLSVNLREHLEQPRAALDACLAGIRDPHVRTGHKLAMVRRAHRIASSKRLPELHSLQPLVPKIGLLEARAVAMSGVLLPSEQEGLPQRCNFLDGDVICSVEYLVIRNAQDMGWQGLHCEGSLFSTIFGLLFWDVILVPLEATMLTAYQAAPLDWMTDSFYARRQSLIASRLAKIRASHVPTMLAQSWQQHHGQLLAGVQWQMCSLATLQDIAACMGSNLVAAVCDLLAQDYRHRRGGLPDLVLWRMDGPGVGSCRFVEVKSDNDRLADKQHVWLHVLRALGADVAVCHVKNTGGKRPRARVRGNDSFYDDGGDED